MSDGGGHDVHPFALTWSEEAWAHTWALSMDGNAYMLIQVCTNVSSCEIKIKEF